ncbi:alpha-crystallin A chain [Ixodes scapularis]|uniref:alpha-crystallin A chain n=1 Tax=Ixodes scapularis TaxID=6945 RepID=UPI001A9E4511|nr:alpha-crystallin A chain [Ixodes scapularis]
MPFRRSLAPSLFGRHRDKVDWWDAWEYPPRIFDQKFGVDLRDEDLFDREPFFRRRLGAVSPRRTQQTTAIGDGCSRSTGVSEVVNDDSKFEVRLDVSHFKPSEITVKLVGTDAVVVHGRHDERQDEHGFVSREFTRRYMLPPDVNIDDVVSEFVAEADGVLVVRAAKKSPEPAAVQERVVPIAVLSTTSKNE